MMSVKLYKIRPGKLEALLAWGAKLMGEFQEEALETLKEEQCSLEGFAIFKIGDGHYAIGYQEHDGDLLKATDRELNHKHKEVLRECLEPLGTDVQSVYFLK